MKGADELTLGSVMRTSVIRISEVLDARSIRLALLLPVLVLSGCDKGTGVNVRDPNRTESTASTTSTTTRTAATTHGAASDVPTSHPATTQAAARPADRSQMKLTATFVRVPPVDMNTKLTWTAWPGAANYRVDFSNDAGKTFYDSITTDSTIPDATLENTPFEEISVRVAAIDANGLTLAVSDLLKLIPEDDKQPARAVPVTGQGP